MRPLDTFSRQHWASFGTRLHAPGLCLYPYHRGACAFHPVPRTSPTYRFRFRPSRPSIWHSLATIRPTQRFLVTALAIFTSLPSLHTLGLHFIASQVCKLANYATPPDSPLAYRALESPFSLQYKGRLGGMENERRARQNPSGYASQQGTLLPPHAASYPVASAPDRFRQPPLTASAPPTTATLPSSASRAPGYAYPYGESPQFASAIQPAAAAAAAAAGVSYGTQDYAADQHQPSQRPTQSYSPYGQNLMYGVSGAQGSASASSQYEPVEQYQQNRDSAIQVLSTGFGVAQPQYYESGPTSAPVSASVPSQYPSLAYTASPAQVGREALAPAFTASGMSDPHHAPAQGSYAHGYPEPQSSSHEYDDFYNNYQTELKKTFEYVRDTRLSEAGAQLYRLSDWLLHWAETLGKFLFSGSLSLSSTPSRDLSWNEQLN